MIQEQRTLFATLDQPEREGWRIDGLRRTTCLRITDPISANSKRLVKGEEEVQNKFLISQIVQTVN